MFKSYIIETLDGPAGIVVRDGRGFRFFAATRDFDSLEGKLFATPKAAETAAHDERCGSREGGLRTGQHSRGRRQVVTDPRLPVPGVYKPSNSAVER